MNNLTICIPVGPAHMHIWSEAANSVEAQTVPCDLIVQHDTLGKGSGWARNAALERVVTPWVSFLDADDILDPHFAELCLGVLHQHRSQGNEEPRYIYSDWIGANGSVYTAPAPCKAWTEKTFHLVTAVIPTDRARLIGGFDEVLQGVEDADFYIRLRLSGVCGLHVERPLVHYREGGLRSVTARASGEESRALMYMTQRYGGYDFMGCCGDNARGPIDPTNQPEEGDVLVITQWSGNRQERGRVSGRLYPRSGNGKLMYVNAADADASPHLWKRQTVAMQASNGVVLKPQYRQEESDWGAIAETIFGGGQAPLPVSAPIEYKRNYPAKKKGDVVKAAQAWTKVEGEIEP